MKRKLSMTLAIILVSTSFAGCDKTQDSSLSVTNNEVSPISKVNEIVEEELQESVEESLQDIVEEEPQQIIEDKQQIDVVEETIAENPLEIVVEKIQVTAEEESISVINNIIEDELEEKDVISNNVDVMVTTKNIEYKFNETEFKLLKKVPSYMADYFPSDSEGNLNDGFNAVITEISFKNMSSENNTFMLNYTSLRPVENGVVTSYVNDMRYFTLMNPDSKLTMQYTLKPYEEITCEVAFCVSDFFYSISDITAIVVNPDGTNPINENARVVPVTIV